MTASFTLLAPALPTADAKMLRVAMNHAGLRFPDKGIADVLPGKHPGRGPSPYVLSVGKAALDIWHSFGLITVTANQGDMFTHHAADGHTYKIMVVEHPAMMNQQVAFSKYSAREDMLRNLQRFKWVLGGGRMREYTPVQCGGCLATRGKLIVRPAEHWVPELDGVGLCEDHYRRRAKYKKKVATVAKKDKGKIEHQIPGQREMFGGGGEKVMVDKR